MGLDTERGPWTVTIFHQLNFEWERLRADTHANRMVERWADEDDRLARARSLEAIEAATRGPIDHHTDALFCALLERAVCRSEEGALAGRVVLQLMLGRGVLTAHALRSFVPAADERAQLVVAAMWEAIRAFPVGRRTRYITPWLAWDIHARAKRVAVAACAEIPMEEAHLVAAREVPMQASEELAKVLAWSVAEGVLSREEAVLLATRYGQEGPGKGSWSSLADAERIAERMGLSAAAVRQRCSRAARKLSQAAARYVATNVF